MKLQGIFISQNIILKKKTILEYQPKIKKNFYDNNLHLSLNLVKDVDFRFPSKMYIKKTTKNQKNGPLLVTMLDLE